jgi:succinate-semialdehyde dehydrogenase / glutarate-semialdehyde dehydrogenase
MRVNSINPANGKVIQSYQTHSSKEVVEIIKLTQQTWNKWRDTPFSKRSKHLNAAAKILRSRKEELAVLMALEMGKPLHGGRAEIEKCADVCEYYAKNGEQFLKDELVETDASKSYVKFQPLGIVLAVMPWNFPFWQVFRFLAPALMAGNAALLKHASNVFGCATQIENIIIEAGFPKNLFRILLIPGNEVDQVIENPLVQAVSLTGSTEVGRMVAAKAASLLKKSVLELGGSDAYLILEDADLELAAESCVNSRLINSGQSCIAAKRFIVLKSIEQEFTELIRQKMAVKVMGDPMDKNTDVGPQARPDLRNELHEQVLKSVKMGAKCILGGVIPAGNHSFYPPTILIEVKKGMPAYEEELFGPVATIISANDEEHAIRIANETSFGLGAAVFTEDLKHGEEIASQRLQAGSCFVNALVRSDPRLPFGGIKQSGYGRELGIYGIREFVNVKTVFVS